jgi:hypothetical protein
MIHLRSARPCTQLAEEIFQQCPLTFGHHLDFAARQVAYIAGGPISHGPHLREGAEPDHLHPP